MTHDEYFQETNFNINDVTSSRSTVSTRSRSIPTSYDPWSPIPSVYFIGSSITSTGYETYRSRTPTDRKINTERRLHMSLFGIMSVGGILLLIICLASLLAEEKIPAFVPPDEPINELVLVLNTLSPENLPVIIAFNGSWRTVHDFQYAQAGFHLGDSSAAFYWL